ncbi:MAG: ethanolamine utilization protein EutN [Deltaproteobacteria bacterium]|nr:ethanolamine utilization protein EutN [Deltaproteobacteria bacterium]
MKAGRVIGEVWATRKARGLEGQKMLLVALEEETRVIVALDTLGAGPSDRVLVSWGSGGRNVLQSGSDNRQKLCDAAISVVVEGSSEGEGEHDVHR